VTWATSVPILVFLGLSVLDLGPMYATDRRQMSDKKHRLMPLSIRGGGIKSIQQMTAASLFKQTNSVIHTVTHVGVTLGDSFFCRACN